MFGTIFGLKGMAVAAGIALLVGAAGGWKTRDAFCDAAAAKKELALEQARTAFLQKRLQIAHSIGTADAAQMQLNQAKLDDLEDKIRELESITDGKCLDAGDTDRLRDLWK